MKTPHHTKIHNRFRLNGYSFSAGDLKEIGYDYIKEGAPYEQSIGHFIMDWMDKEDFILVKTSGSTGDPKRIPISKQAMVSSAIRTGNFFNVNIGDTALHCLPADFIAGKMMLVRAMILGLSLELVKPSAHPMKDLYRSYDFAAMTPMQAYHSLDRLHQVKTLIIGGAPISAALQEQLVAIHSNCYETYGMTETITHIAARRIALPQKPFQALEGIHLNTDAEGCLLVDAPDISDQRITTHDLVELHDKNTFTYLGRKDHVVNSGGFKISPEMVEKKLSRYLELPFFLYGIPDTILGQKLVLVVEGDPSESEAVKTQLATCKSLKKHEKPKTVFFTPEILKNNGKYLRKKTMAQLGQV